MGSGLATPGRHGRRRELCAPGLAASGLERCGRKAPRRGSAAEERERAREGQRTRVRERKEKARAWPGSTTARAPHVPGSGRHGLGGRGLGRRSPRETEGRELDFLWRDWVWKGLEIGFEFLGWFFSPGFVQGAKGGGNETQAHTRSTNEEQFSQLGFLANRSSR